MEPSTPALLERTIQPRYPNGQRKLARNVFMQTTWALLALTALGQLFLLFWLDLLS
jgi:peptidoglycan biosynthesis protein MviN/MurJ (putative lipid II flippase)